MYYCSQINELLYSKRFISIVILFEKAFKYSDDARY
jgi:hypothetical protein